MSDLYLEEMVKRRWTAKDKAIRMILMVLTVLLIIGAFFVHYILVFPAIAICVADIFIFPRFNVGISVCKRRTGCGPYHQ